MPWTPAREAGRCRGPKQISFSSGLAAFLCFDFSSPARWEGSKEKAKISERLCFYLWKLGASEAGGCVVWRLGGPHGILHLGGDRSPGRAAEPWQSGDMGLPELHVVCPVAHLAGGQPSHPRVDAPLMKPSNTRRGAFPVCL